MAEGNKAQKVLVVGAGPVGALAALYAANRGDDVHVYELRAGKNLFLPTQYRGIQILGVSPLSLRSKKLMPCSTTRIQTSFQQEPLNQIELDCHNFPERHLVKMEY